MKIKGNVVWDRGKIIKRPEGIGKPAFKKGDKVPYVHDEYGQLTGIVADVYLLKSKEGIFYDVDFRFPVPKEKNLNGVTVQAIPESKLISYSQKK